MHLKLFFLRLPGEAAPEACYKLQRGAYFVYSGEGQKSVFARLTLARLSAPS
jgi:hypothetical protein